MIFLMKIQIHLDGDEEKLKKSAKFLEGTLLELIHTPVHEHVDRRVISPLIETKVKKDANEYFLAGYNITDFDKKGEVLNRSYVSVKDLVRGHPQGFSIS